jgi:hypothetical protein
MRPSLLLLPLLSLSLFACAGETNDGAETSEHGIEVFAQDLWAGLPSATIERYSSDPCANTNRLDNWPIGYDSWVRQRAGVRNVCFEVWKPGVTDTENNDYWRVLDVQVHYRYQGSPDWKTAYVPSIDRKGNNRRYAWSLTQEMDPLVGSNVADAKAGFYVKNESATSAQVESTLEFYFTINGHKLTTSTNDNFRVAYQTTVEKPEWASPPANGAVLYPEITCDGAKVGSGAGYFAVDVKDEAAIDKLATKANYEIPAARIGITGNAPSRTLSLTFGSRDANGNYVDGYYAPSSRAETKLEGSNLTLSVKVYDKVQNQVATKSATFGNCVRQ